MPIARDLRTWLLAIKAKDPNPRPSEGPRNQYVVEILGISAATVSRIIREDRPGDVPVSTIDDMAQHLGVDPYQVLLMIEGMVLPASTQSPSGT